VVVTLAGTGPIFTATRVSLSDAVKAAGDRGIHGRRPPPSAHTRRCGADADRWCCWLPPGLLLRSYANVVGVDPGFEPRNVLVAETVLPQAKYSALPERQAFYDGVLGARPCACGSSPVRRM
jgi:hypothetical protein